MEFIGVIKMKFDFEVYLVRERGIFVYVVSEEFFLCFEKVGFEVVGMFSDFLENVDVIVDVILGGMGVKNKVFYEKVGVKVIFQGGEKVEVVQVLFVV